MSGSVMSCTRDLSRTPRLVSGNERIVQALFRRLTTPRGMLGKDRSYGTCVEDMLGETVTKAEIETLRQAVVSECMKQRGVRRVVVDTDWNAQERRLSMKVKALGPNGEFAFSATSTDETGLVLDG